MARRFEFVAGSSAKFYEIMLEDNTVQVRYGRIGTAGQQLTKSFADAAAAAKHADKLAAEKLAKGYAECAAC